MFKIKSCCFLLLFIWLFNFNNAFAMKRGHDDECATATEDQVRVKRLKAIEECLEKENDDDFMSRLNTLSSNEKGGIKDWQKKYLLRFLMSDSNSSPVLIDALLSSENVMGLLQPLSDIVFPRERIFEYIARSNGMLRNILDGESLKRMYYVDMYRNMNILNKCESDYLRYIALKNSGGVADTEYRLDGALSFQYKDDPSGNFHQGMENKTQNNPKHFVGWDNEQGRLMRLTAEKASACQTPGMLDATTPLRERVGEVAKKFPEFKNAQVSLLNAGKEKLGEVKKYEWGIDAVTGLSYRYFLVKGQDEVLNLWLNRTPLENVCFDSSYLVRFIRT